jgi:hypothetical protein
MKVSRRLSLRTDLQISHAWRAVGGLPVDGSIVSEHVNTGNWGNSCGHAIKSLPICSSVQGLLGENIREAQARNDNSRSYQLRIDNGKQCGSRHPRASIGRCLTYFTTPYTAHFPHQNSSFLDIIQCDMFYTCFMKA